MPDPDVQRLADVIGAMDPPPATELVVEVEAAASKRGMTCEWNRYVDTDTGRISWVCDIITPRGTMRVAGGTIDKSWQEAFAEVGLP